MHGHSFFRVTARINTTDPFEDHKFCGRTCCKKGRPARNSNGDTCCVGPDWSCFGRNLEKNRALGQLCLTSSGRETEDRVRAEPRDSEIVKSQFRARFDSGAHCRAEHHLIIHHRGTRRGMRFQQPHVLNYLRHACLLQWHRSRSSGNERQGYPKRCPPSAAKNFRQNFFHMNSITVMCEPLPGPGLALVVSPLAPQLCNPDQRARRVFRRRK